MFGLNEAEIVQGLQCGDRDAWEALCHQYSSRVWRYVARLVGGDDEGVADVYQETMLAVAKSGRRISINTRLWSWLAGIGHNQAAIYWRKRYRDRQTSLDTDLLTDSSESAPLAALTRLETVQSVRCLLAEMDAEQVAVLTAKYLDGLTVSEIKRELGGTIESIRSRLARARGEFRERYERLLKQQGEIETSPGKGD